MHTLLAALRAHNFNLPAAAAALPDDQLLAAAADQTLLAHLESLLNLSRLCLALQAAASRHALLTDLASAAPDSPAEQRRLANTLTRAADTRALMQSRGGTGQRIAGTGARPVPASQPPPEQARPSSPQASMPPASMPPASMPAPPSSSSIPPPCRRAAHAPAARLLAAAALPPRAPDTG